MKSENLFWINNLTKVEGNISPILKIWVSDICELTKNLRQVYRNWNLELLYSGPLIPSELESKAFSSKTNIDDCYGRIILHKDHSRPLVLGRVIIPKQTYGNIGPELTCLGSRSIGEEILFRHTNTTRSSFSYAVISKNNQIISEWLDKDIDVKSEVLVRTSTFYINKALPLLVSEYFLNNLKYPEVR